MSLLESVPEMINEAKLTSLHIFISSKAMEVAILLSLMIASSAEDSQLYIKEWNYVEELKLKSDVLLENVRSVKKQIKVRICFALCVNTLH